MSVLHPKLVAGEFSRVHDLMAAWEQMKSSYSQKAKGEAKDGKLIAFVFNKMPESTTLFVDQINQLHKVNLSVEPC